jgi:hypothetical protein
MSEFVSFPKIPRLNRDIVITEKIDGTNASVVIEDYRLWPDGQLPADAVARVGDYGVFAGARNNYRQPGKGDNHGLAAFVQRNAEALVKALGPGRHFGEWWGPGINRGYGLAAKRFSLFNVSKWRDLSLDLEGGSVRSVPVLYEGPWFNAGGEFAPVYAMEYLRKYGSQASHGFMRPEGIVVFHTAGSVLFKATLENDEKPKGKEA